MPASSTAPCAAGAISRAPSFEGAIVRRGSIEWFQRGNGGASGDLAPANAIGRLGRGDFLGWLDGGAPPPGLHDVVGVDLGRVGAVPFGFTDATLASDGARISRRGRRVSAER